MWFNEFMEQILLAIAMLCQVHPAGSQYRASEVELVHKQQVTCQQKLALCLSNNHGNPSGILNRCIAEGVHK
jgi:hypothetical protein